ncbi:glycine zipper 2TM domain-containing protein [Denitratisoma oestradiolicum]|uniref:Glycine zipper 2TM domain-containing protein n=1 Tax=Denitratisoma oestradiolicum TaxID=311182 RepID=A0A6S6Y6T2_9PROT|nr:glycine zipper 2TM domain-containing protein [Denitratisoma oestradiolicum]TWO79226.1 hypothetical protein CBW56_15670 [Denitratisoma oestradiolicum]CAB1368228.1 conserved protein of unknown function [Denitratisoma oestradiolicum]
METPSLFKRSPPKLLYPALIVAAICVTLFSLLGIATMTGHLPGALAGINETSPAAQSAAKLAAAPCADCGVAESIRAITVKGSGSGTGAVIGGIAGAVLGNTMGRGNGRTAMTLIGGGAGAYAGNEIEKNSNRHMVWQTRVRMEDGSVRTFSTHSQPEFGVGAKVRVMGGQVVPYRSAS